MTAELLFAVAVVPEQVADPVLGPGAVPGRRLELCGKDAEVADGVRVVPGALEVDRTRAAVEEVVAGRRVAVDRASGVLADPRAAPPRSEEAVEPLPPGSREPVLVENRVEVGKVAFPVAGGPRAVVEPPEQVRDTGQGLVEGGSRRDEFPHGRAGDVLGHEDCTKPAALCKRPRDPDPTGCATEPVKFVLHRSIRVVAGLRTRRRAEEFADDALPPGELIPADDVRRGLYPVDPGAALPPRQPVGDDARKPVPERISRLQASHLSLGAHPAPSSIRRQGPGGAAGL